MNGLAPCFVSSLPKQIFMMSLQVPWGHSLGIELVSVQVRKSQILAQHVQRELEILGTPCASLIYNKR